MQSLRASRLSAQQIVVGRLRHAILTGELPAGARLMLRDIAGQLGVSTTPVREAIGLLANEGLVRIDPYRGATVYQPCIEELRGIYELRAMVEAYGVKLAVPRMTDGEIARAEELVDKMARTTDLSDWLLLNRAFHSVLTDAAGSWSVSRTLGVLRDVSSLYIALSFDARPARLAESNEEHRQIALACRRCDAEGAAELIQLHVMATLKLAETGLAQLDAAKRPVAAVAGEADCVPAQVPKEES